jgi:hypothetical protein
MSTKIPGGNARCSKLVEETFAQTDPNQSVERIQRNLTDLQKKILYRKPGDAFVAKMWEPTHAQSDQVVAALACRPDPDDGTVRLSRDMMAISGIGAAIENLSYDRPETYERLISLLESNGINPATLALPNTSQYPSQSLLERVVLTAHNYHLNTSNPGAKTAFDLVVEAAMRSPHKVHPSIVARAYARPGALLVGVGRQTADDILAKLRSLAPGVNLANQPVHTTVSGFHDWALNPNNAHDTQSDPESYLTINRPEGTAFARMVTDLSFPGATDSELSHLDLVTKELKSGANSIKRYPESAPNDALNGLSRENASGNFAGDLAAAMLDQLKADGLAGDKRVGEALVTAVGTVNDPRLWAEDGGDPGMPKLLNAYISRGLGLDGRNPTTGDSVFTAAYRDAFPKKDTLSKATRQELVAAASRAGADVNGLANGNLNGREPGAKLTALGFAMQGLYNLEPLLQSKQIDRSKADAGDLVWAAKNRWLSGSSTQTGVIRDVSLGRDELEFARARDHISSVSELKSNFDALFEGFGKGPRSVGTKGLSEALVEGGHASDELENEVVLAAADSMRRHKVPFEANIVENLFEKRGDQESGVSIAKILLEHGAKPAPLNSVYGEKIGGYPQSRKPSDRFIALQLKHGMDPNVGVRNRIAMPYVSKERTTGITPSQAGSVLSMIFEEQNVTYSSTTTSLLVDVARRAFEVRSKDVGDEIRQVQRLPSEKPARELVQALMESDKLALPASLRGKTVDEILFKLNSTGPNQTYSVFEFNNDGMPTKLNIKEVDADYIAAARRHIVDIGQTGAYEMMATKLVQLGARPSAPL